MGNTGEELTVVETNQRTQISVDEILQLYREVRSENGGPDMVSVNVRRGDESVAKSLLLERLLGNMKTLLGNKGDSDASKFQLQGLGHDKESVTRFLKRINSDANIDSNNLKVFHEAFTQLWDTVSKPDSQTVKARPADIHLGRGSV